MTVWFIWSNSPGGPWPQKWYGESFIDPETKQNRLEAINILFKQKLSDKEAAMSLNELKFVYPLK